MSPDLSQVSSGTEPLPVRAARKWAALSPVAIFGAAFLLLWPTASSLIKEWEDEANNTTYTHGYLIAAVCVWLLFRNRSRLQTLPLASNAAACVLLAIAGFAWLIGVRSGIQSAHQLLPIIVWLTICAALGLRAACISSFAVGYLYFAIPLWGHINGALQSATVVAVDLLLRATDITAYVQGNFVYLPAGIIEIAHGCSGLHYFIVALAIGALYGEIHRDDLKTRALQLLLAAALALVTNWVRVYIITIAGYLTDMKHYLVSESHYMFGWYVFAGSMVIFFLIVRRMKVAEEQPTLATPATALSPKSSLQYPLGAVLSFAALAAAPLWELAMPPEPAALPAAHEVLPSDLSADWWGPNAASATSWRPVFVGADVEAHGSYSSVDRKLEVYVAVYGLQQQGKELIGYENSLLGKNADASIVARSTIDVRGPATELVLRARLGEEFLIWYFYRIGSLQTDRDLVAQLAYGVRSLVGAPLSRIVALRTRCEPDCDEARAILQSFVDSANF
jgi:exosortase A